MNDQPSLNFRQVVRDILASDYGLSPAISSESGLDEQGVSLGLLYIVRNIRDKKDVMTFTDVYHEYKRRFSMDLTEDDMKERGGRPSKSLLYKAIQNAAASLEKIGLISLISDDFLTKRETPTEDSKRFDKPVLTENLSALRAGL